ncbi:MAG: QueT transporter family protein [Clostridia bacterium]|nr:QueT transporter family protein [Clostridia bacterium]
MNKKLLFVTHSAMIAALYVIFTMISNMMGLALGPIEFRFSEGLTILPVFTPAAIPGLTIGCMLANFLVGGNPFDIFLGSAATLIGALGTYAFRNNRFLPYLPPIAANTLIVVPVLFYTYTFVQEAGWGLPLYTLIFFTGEALSVFLFGFLIKQALLPVQNKLK